MLLVKWHIARYNVRNTKKKPFFAEKKDTSNPVHFQICAFCSRRLRHPDFKTIGF
jgi:hypothetical protein